ncbi:hypothetical protein Agub_g4070 [Astrephomene gubernaculifera]|uniref:Uncharacterized protein n=1 Tax=Astrephomene gubernaculifera TaxID=47775 RepID=A0AAD3DK63_9CHLO|nr:hypothetical protein Agub_g4070 [Astrephomene gubernaculifera]
MSDPLSQLAYTAHVLSKKTSSQLQQPQPPHQLPPQRPARSQQQLSQQSRQSQQTQGEEAMSETEDTPMAMDGDDGDSDGDYESGAAGGSAITGGQPTSGTFAGGMLPALGGEAFGGGGGCAILAGFGGGDLGQAGRGAGLQFGSPTMVGINGMRAMYGSGGGSGKRLSRRPVQFWAPFNDWWRSEFERTGKRPSGDEVGDWYIQKAPSIWGAEAPSLEETRTHAKCLRSVGSIREYFRGYRARKRARHEDVGGAADGMGGLSSPTITAPRSAPSASTPATTAAAAAASGLQNLQHLAAISSLLPQLSALNPVSLAQLQLAAAAAANRAAPSAPAASPAALLQALAASASQQFQHTARPESQIMSAAAAASSCKAGTSLQVPSKPQAHGGLMPYAMPPDATGAPMALLPLPAPGSRAPPLALGLPSSAGGSTATGSLASFFQGGSEEKAGGNRGGDTCGFNGSGGGSLDCGGLSVGPSSGGCSTPAAPASVLLAATNTATPATTASAVSEGTCHPKALTTTLGPSHKGNQDPGELAALLLQQTQMPKGVTPPLGAGQIAALHHLLTSMPFADGAAVLHITPRATTPAAGQLQAPAKSQQHQQQPHASNTSGLSGPATASATVTNSGGDDGAGDKGLTRAATAGLPAATDGGIGNSPGNNGGLGHSGDPSRQQPDQQKLTPQPSVAAPAPSSVVSVPSLAATPLEPPPERPPALAAAPAADPRSLQPQQQTLGLRSRSPSSAPTPVAAASGAQLLGCQPTGPSSRPPTAPVTTHAQALQPVQQGQRHPSGPPLSQPQGGMDRFNRASPAAESTPRHQQQQQQCQQRRTPDHHTTHHHQQQNAAPRATPPPAPPSVAPALPTLPPIPPLNNGLYGAPPAPGLAPAPGTAVAAASPAATAAGAQPPSLRSLLAQPDDELCGLLRGLPHDQLVVLLLRAVATVRQKKAHEERLMDELSQMLEQQGNLQAQLHTQRVEASRLYRDLLALREEAAHGAGGSCDVGGGASVAMATAGVGSSGGYSAGPLARATTPAAAAATSGLRPSGSAAFLLSPPAPSMGGDVESREGVNGHVPNPHHQRNHPQTLPPPISTQPLQQQPSGATPEVGAVAVPDAHASGAGGAVAPLHSGRGSVEDGGAAKAVVCSDGGSGTC